MGWLLIGLVVVAACVMCGFFFGGKSAPAAASSVPARMEFEGVMSNPNHGYHFLLRKAEEFDKTFGSWGELRLFHKPTYFGIMEIVATDPAVPPHEDVFRLVKMALFDGQELDQNYFIDLEKVPPCQQYFREIYGQELKINRPNKTRVITSKGKEARVACITTFTHDALPVSFVVSMPFVEPICLGLVLEATARLLQTFERG